MGVMICKRCDAYVDLDWNVDDFIFMKDTSGPFGEGICIECLLKLKGDDMATVTPYLNEEDKIYLKEVNDGK